MTQPVRIGIAGMSHDHVFGLWRRPKRDDIEIVGIYEPDRALAERYAKRFSFRFDRLFDDLGAMVDAVHPEAVRLLARFSITNRWSMHARRAGWMSDGREAAGGEP